MQDYGGPIGNRIIDAPPGVARSGRSSRTPTPTRRASRPPGTASATPCGSTAAPRPKRRSLPFLQLDTVKPVYTTGTAHPEHDQPRQLEHGLALPGAAARARWCSWTSSTTTAPTSSSIRRGRRSCASASRRRSSSGDRTTSSSPPKVGEAYLRDLPEAELHLLDTGHFAVEDSLDEIAAHIDRFYDSRVNGSRA